MTEPKWMVGIEWDMIALLRDIYCRLVLGQVLQPGGQGPGLQQPISKSRNSFEQAKYVDRPLQGGGILCVPSDLPRKILLELPGVSAESIQLLHNCLKEKRAAKDQVIKYELSLFISYVTRISHYYFHCNGIHL